MNKSDTLDKMEDLIGDGNIKSSADRANSDYLHAIAIGIKFLVANK